MRVLVLIACSKRKADRPRKAKELYLGRLFQEAKQFAERRGYEYRIISAKFGLIDPDTIIAPYDQTIRTKEDLLRVRELVLPRLEKMMERFERIIVFGGKKYRQVLEPLWDERFTFVKSKGYGELCKKIHEATFGGGTIE